MKPILFFDFDMTICRDRFWRSLGAYDYDRIQTMISVDHAAMFEEWMRGKWTSEEINRFIANHLDIPYETLWDAFVTDAKTMYVAPETLERVAALRDKFHTVLVTINVDSFGRFTVPALGLDAYFDRIDNSSDHGRFKYDDDGALFADLARELAAPITDSFLFDDSPRNCEVFAKLGGTACQVDNDRTVVTYLDQLIERVD